MARSHRRCSTSHAIAPHRKTASVETMPSITCPKCRMTSYDREDIANRYCGNCHEFHDQMVITSTCPTCGAVMDRQVYDIGSGPELSCANCEWCWGAAGQDLKLPRLDDLAKMRKP